MATATAKANNEIRELLGVKSPSELVEWFNGFIYGDAGVGKTYLLGTAVGDPRMSPALVIDSEGGMATLRKLKDVDILTVRSMKDIEKIGSDLARSIDKGKMYYKTVAIDSLTELADLDMRNVMKEAYAKNPEKVHPDVPSPREWGIVRNHMRLIVRHFRDLPCHTVWTGHVTIVEADAEKAQPRKFFPGFAGKLAREIPGFMDIVGYYSQKANAEGVITRTLQFQGTDRVIAKDRTGALGALVENPTLPMLWDLIEASQ